MFTRPLLLFLLLWGYGSQITGALSIVQTSQVRIVELMVPAHAREGGSALLGCQYDLKGSELYSLKWFKDEQEFFRYAPQQFPSIMIFVVPGVHVNVVRSSSTVVALENLSQESEGNYTCEVSGDAPYFSSTRSSKFTTIHLLPDSDPHVSGLKEQYRLYEEVIANCTSSASRPMAQLKWLVNDVPASPQDVQGPWHSTLPDRPDAVETTLQLRFNVAPRHYVIDNIMKLKCQATIAPLYQRETNSVHYIELPATTNNAPIQNRANSVKTGQIRIVELIVPDHAREGGSALLGCQYDLNGSDLYNLKWYKDGQEFYRYAPQEVPQIMIFNVPGVHVNVTKSSSTVVALENLSQESEGNYTCELLGDAPHFSSAMSSKFITIHLLPDGGPRVSGLKEHYHLNEEAVINCTSSASKPMAQLRWLVNDEPASPHDLHGPWYWVSPNRPDAVETTLQLRFTVAPRHFVGSTMKLKCQATIAPLYQRETNSTHYMELPVPKNNAPI